MLEVTAQQVRAMRLRAQRLYPQAACEDAAEVVRALCGVNAQFGPAMMLSLRARLREAKPGDLMESIDARRTLVKTWAMRGTMHLLFRDDADLILPLVGPAAIAKLRSRRRELGLDDEKLARGLREIRAILEDAGPSTRGELVGRLNDRGLKIDRRGQAIYHLIACAGLEGTIFLGPHRPDGEQTYVLSGLPTRDRKTLPNADALADLADRYLRGYGPAGLADFVAWSGLKAADAKKGWELLRERGLTTDIMADGQALRALKSGLAPEGISTPADTVVNLLPAFDTLVLGYSDRELVVPEEHYKEVYHGGQTVPIVLVNGEAAGVWRYKIRSGRIGLEVRPFEAFDRRVKDLVEEEAKDIGRFFGLAPGVTWVAEEGR